MNFNFQKFEKKNLRFETRITVTASSAIGFPSKFYEDNGIKNFKFVVLFFDKDKKAIGISLTNNDSEKGRFTIAHSKKGIGATVSAKSFFRNNGIDPHLYKGRYQWEKEAMDGYGDIYIITLVERKTSAELEKQRI